jgi:hypothetical protein
MSTHTRRDVELAALIHTTYERSYRTYGARRVHADLREAYGVRVGRKRVARLMRQAGSKGARWCSTALKALRTRNIGYVRYRQRIRAVGDEVPIHQCSRV